jgi:hypothetical protein
MPFVVRKSYAVPQKVVTCRGYASALDALVNIPCYFLTSVAKDRLPVNRSAGAKIFLDFSC